MGIILTLVALLMLIGGGGLIGSGNKLITERTPGHVIMGMIGNLICGTIWVSSGFILLAIIWS